MGKLQKEAKRKKRQEQLASKAQGRSGSSVGSPIAAQATPTEQLNNVIRTCSRMANSLAASHRGKALIVGVACCIWSTVFLGLTAVY